MKTLPKMTKEQKELVEQYKYIAWSSRFRRYFDNNFPYVSKEDIYQFLLYGLCRAAIGYNPNKNCKFITYAYKTMYHLAKRQINQDRWLICNPKLCSDNDCQRDIPEFRNNYIEPEIFEALFEDNKNSIERVDYSHDIKLEITKLKEAISTLSEEDQMIVKLRYFSGDKVMSYKEMEQYTPGLSYRTLCNRMVKIKQELKKRMSN